MIETVSAPALEYQQLMSFIAIVVCLALAGIIFVRRWKEKPEGWSRPFSENNSLWKLVRMAFRVEFSRWWILTIPLIFSLLSFLELETSYCLKKKYSPYTNAEIEQAINDQASSKDAKTIAYKPTEIELFSRALINAFYSPYNIGRVESHFTGLISLGLLIWILWLKKSRQATQVKATDAVFRAFVLFLVLAFIMEFVWELDIILFMWLGRKVNVWQNILYGFFFFFNLSGKTPLDSIWFAAIFIAVRDWWTRGKDSDADKSSSGKISLINCSLQIFPAFLFLVICWSVFIELIYQIGYLYPFMVPLSILCQVIQAFFTWIFFPLPYIMARNGVGLRRGLELLKQTWSSHFRKLITLAGLVSITAAPFQILDIAVRQNFHREFGFLHNLIHMTDHAWPATEAAELVLIVASLIFIFLAFQSGELDLPSAQDASKINHQEKPEGSEAVAI